jgi:DNA polymerase III subunit delta
MPKLEPKVVQKEIEQGQLWPVYWLYGAERMKSRELLKRIRRAALGETETAGVPGLPALPGLNEETFDGGETSAATVLDAAQSPALGGGLRFIVVREANALKEAEILAPLFGPRAKVEAGTSSASMTSICVFISKDLDGRKKFSKMLLEHAAVVPCEDVPETEHDAWVQYLAKRRGMVLEPALSAILAQLDPWSLDIIDQELEKLSLSGNPDVVLGPGESLGGRGGDDFLNAFFSRDLLKSLRCVESFAERPDESLPLLGLLAWNVRHLALVLADRERGVRTVKLNPYVAEKLQAWSQSWKLDEVLELQTWLEETDFSLKQTPLLPLGVWSGLVQHFL